MAMVFPKEVVRKKNEIYDFTNEINNLIMDNGNLPTNRVQEQISLYLDNALDPDQRQEFLQQIQVDPTLNQAVEKEKHFRSIIRNKIDRPKLEPDFIQYIKNKIH